MFIVSFNFLIKILGLCKDFWDVPNDGQRLAIYLQICWCILKFSQTDTISTSIRVFI